MKFFIVFFFLITTAQATYFDATNSKIIDEPYEECRKLLSPYDQKLNKRLQSNIAGWKYYDLQGVKKRFIDPKKRRWDESDPINNQYTQYWEEVNKHFEEMLQASNEGIDYKCKGEKETRCKDSSAYVLFFFGHPKKTIYVCPSFWSESEGGRLKVLYHELSHYASKSFDYAGDWNNPPQVDLKKAANDAFHLEQFALRSPENALYGLWAILWPKKKN